MKRKLVGCLIAIMFMVIAIPKIEAVENNETNNNHVFGFCYIENIVEGEYDPAPECPYIGCTTILVGGIGTQTTIYSEKGGEELGQYEGPQTLWIFLMFGYHECTETSRIFTGSAFGVLVREK